MCRINAISEKPSCFGGLGRAWEIIHIESSSPDVEKRREKIIGYEDVAVETVIGTKKGSTTADS
jgi:hypothetical protein